MARLQYLSSLHTSFCHRCNRDDPPLRGSDPAVDIACLFRTFHSLRSRHAQMAAVVARQRRSASLSLAQSGTRLHTSGPNERAAAAPNLTRQASPKFAAMVLQNSKQVRHRHRAFHAFDASHTAAQCVAHQSSAWPLTLLSSLALAEAGGAPAPHILRGVAGTAEARGRAAGAAAPTVADCPGGEAHHTVTVAEQPTLAALALTAPEWLTDRTAPHRARLPT